MTKNFEFINDFKEEKMNQMIDEIEKNIDSDHYNFATEIGKLIEASILIAFRKNEKSITLNNAKQILEEEYKSKNQDFLPSMIHLSFITIQKNRNEVSHANISSKYVFTKLTFDQKINLLRSAFNILVLIRNCWLLEFSSKEEIDINSFDSKIYFEENNKTQNVIEQIKGQSIDDNLIGIEKISIGSFTLNKNVFFYIPSYQRKYSWNEDFINDLLENISTNLESNSESQFFGTMAIVVNQEKTRKEFRLIDGQQRVTTSLIIFKVIYQLMQKYRVNDFQILPQPLIDNFVLGNRIDIDKILSVTGDDREFKALRILLKPSESDNKLDLEKELTIYKQTNVVKNYRFAYDFLNERFGSWNKISIFYDYFANKYMISCIDFKKNLNQEMEIFENLNSKGMELSILELIKNSIFLKIKDDVFEENELQIVQTFKNYVDISSALDRLESTKGNSSGHLESLEKEFIYDYIAFYTQNSNHRKERRDLLHWFNKKVMDENNITSLDDFNNFCYKIGKYMLLFIDVQEEEYINPKHYLHELTNEMGLFKEKNALMPILFYLVKVYSNDTWDPITKKFDINEENKKLLQKSILEIEKWIWSLVQTRGGQSPMKPILNLMIFLSKNETKSSFKEQIPKMINDWLAGKRGGDKENEKDVPKIVPDAQTPSKEDFVNALRTRPLKTPIQKILLKRIEMYAIDKGKGTKEVYFKKGSIEHIIPQKIKKTSWIEQIAQERGELEEEILSNHERKKDMIGNLLWLPLEDNSKIKNDSFKIKKEEYKKNLVASATLLDSKQKSLLDLDNFTYKNMDERSEALINLVVETIYSYEKE